MQSFGLASIYVAPSVDLEASKHFFKKAFEVRSFFLSAFCLQSRWSRDPVKMQGFELATIFVAPADFQNCWETDSRKLVGLFGGPTRCFTIPPSHAVWAPRGPEASRDLIWDLLRPHLGISGGLFWDLFSLLSSLFSLLSSLFALLSSPFSLLSSPCRRGLARPRSHESSHPLDSLPHYPWPGGMREAIKSGHRALGATVGAVWWVVGLLLTKPYPLSRSDIPLPTGAARCRWTRENSILLHRGLAANVDVVRSPLGAFLSAPGTPRFRRTRENSMFLHRGLAANVDVVGAVLGSILVFLGPS